MKFGTWLEHTIKKNFRYRDITDLSYGHNGGHFSKWPPPVIILPVAQVLHHLGSWFWWLILRFQGPGVQWYYLQHASNYPTTYGGHFSKWPPPVIILPVSQVLDHLGSWFLWLILHFQGSGMTWYNSKHSSNSPATYIWYPMAIMVAIGKKWRPPVIIWPVAQVLHHLGSWFLWLILHFRRSEMLWYYLQHASNYLTTYIRKNK